eukprot:515055-Pelagomonas_calceolata.AAC.4
MPFQAAAGKAVCQYVIGRACSKVNSIFTCIMKRACSSIANHSTGRIEQQRHCADVEGPCTKSHTEVHSDVIEQ